MTPEQLQPNGIDLRLKKGIKLPIHKAFKLLHDDTQHLDWYIPEGSYCKECFSVLFERGKPYLIETFEYVKIPPNVVAIVYGRSSLNRNGILARSSLYDSGFEDYVGFTLYPWVPFEAHIGVRIAQIVFYSAESRGLYAGQYGIENKQV
jgi:deoxycytidine triphosphate deaminase